MKTQDRTIREKKNIIQFRYAKILSEKKLSQTEALDLLTDFLEELKREDL